MRNDPLRPTTWISLKNGIRLQLTQHRNGWACETWEVDGQAPVRPAPLREPSSREKKHRFATPDQAVRFFSIFFESAAAR
jgi:hypothetical protein